MRRLTLLFLTLVTCSAPIWAAATTYDINFTLTSGTPAPTAGSFTYDPAVGFSNFTVDWNGLTFDLTAAANTILVDSFVGTGCDSESSTPQYAFLVLTKDLTGCSPTYTWAAGGSSGGGLTFVFGVSDGPGSDTFRTTDPYPPDGGLFVEGDWSLTEVQASTPEPTSLALTFLAGLALAGLKRRANKMRKAQGNS